MPAPNPNTNNNRNDNSNNSKEGVHQMKEQDIMLKLTELLFQDQLITPDEKLKLTKLIRSPRNL